ncbi:MAG: hypothetical protein AAFQ89_02590 [Cyanobacteria bacterium J06626_18]
MVDELGSTTRFPLYASSSLNSSIWLDADNHSSLVTPAESAHQSDRSIGTGRRSLYFLSVTVAASR